MPRPPLGPFPAVSACVSDHTMKSPTKRKRMPIKICLRLGQRVLRDTDWTIAGFIWPPKSCRYTKQPQNVRQVQLNVRLVGIQIPQKFISLFKISIQDAPTNVPFTVLSLCSYHFAAIALSLQLAIVSSSYYFPPLNIHLRETTCNFYLNPHL